MGVGVSRFARSDGQGLDFLALRACTGMRARLRFLYKIKNQHVDFQVSGIARINAHCFNFLALVVVHGSERVW